MDDNVDKNDSDARQRVQAGRMIQAGPWMGLLALGLGFVFACRFFGLRGNPSGVWIEPAPLFGSALAGSIVVLASLRLMRAWSERNLHGFRVSLLLVMLGAAMLVGSMVSKSIVQAVFG